MTAKLLSKEIEKNVPVSRKFGKSVSSQIGGVDSVELSYSLNITICNKRSAKDLTFCEKNQPDKKIVTETNNHFEHSFEHEDDDVVDEIEIPVQKNRLKSECVRNSLKIDWDTFTFNTSCRRCNYLERLIDAQRKDVSSLQNQIESFIKGTYDDTDIIPESEQLLKSEPVFNKIFPDNNMSIDPLQQEIQQIEGSPRKKTLEKKSSSTSTNSGNKSQVKIVQKSDESNNNFLIFDEEKHKRIQKYEQEIDNLSAQLMAFMKKNKSLEYIRSENENLRQQITKTEAVRVELEQKLITATNDYIARIKTSTKDNERLLTEKNQLQEKLSRDELDINSLSFDNNKFSIKVKELEESLKINKVNIDVITNHNNTTNALKEFNKFDKVKVEKQDEISRSIAELNNKQKQLLNDNYKLSDENNALHTKIRDIENSLQAKNREIAEKLRKIVELETTNLVLKNEQLNTNEIIRHRDELTIKFNRIMEINFNLQENISSLNKNFNEEIKILQDKLSLVENENLKVKNNFEKKTTEINSKQNKIDGNIF
jgi:hypothetical protein